MAVADTTVSIELPDGTTTDPIPLDEFEERAHDAAARLRGEQLTFDVGLPGARPEFGSVKIGGAFAVEKDLAYGREVRVMLTALDGEVLVDRKVRVTAIAFKKDKDACTERIHTLG